MATRPIASGRPLLARPNEPNLEGGGGIPRGGRTGWRSSPQHVTQPDRGFVPSWSRMAALGGAVGGAVSPYWGFPEFGPRVEYEVLPQRYVDVPSQGWEGLVVPGTGGASVIGHAPDFPEVGAPDGAPLYGQINPAEWRDRHRLGETLAVMDASLAASLAPVPQPVRARRLLEEARSSAEARRELKAPMRWLVHELEIAAAPSRAVQVRLQPRRELPGRRDRGPQNMKAGGDVYRRLLAVVNATAGVASEVQDFVHVLASNVWMMRSDGSLVRPYRITFDASHALMGVVRGDFVLDFQGFVQDFVLNQVMDKAYAATSLGWLRSGAPVWQAVHAPGDSRLSGVPGEYREMQHGILSQVERWFQEPGLLRARRVRSLFGS